MGPPTINHGSNPPFSLGLASRSVSIHDSTRCRGTRTAKTTGLGLVSWALAVSLAGDFVPYIGACRRLTQQDWIFKDLKGR